MNLYKSIVKNLTEIAENKRVIISKIEDKERMVMEHLIKCWLYPNNSNYQHWKNEIHGFIPRISALKGANKFPKYEQLKKWIIDGFSDSLHLTIFAYIERVTIKYGEVKYDAKQISDYIISYYEWLMFELSSKGYVSPEEVSQKIDNLVKEES